MLHTHTHTHTHTHSSHIGEPAHIRSLDTREKSIQGIPHVEKFLRKPLIGAYQIIGAHILSARTHMRAETHTPEQTHT
jgi:hypothetical protein